MRADPPGPPGPPDTGLPDTLAAAVRIAADRWPDRTAWRFDPGESLTFADIRRLTDGYALALAEQGVGPGDRVAVMLANEPAFPLTWLALSLLGAIMVPLNTKYRTADAGHVLRACGASAIVTGAQFEPLLRPVAAELPGPAALPGLPGPPPVLPVADLARAASQPSRPGPGIQISRCPTRPGPRISSSPPAPPAGQRAASCPTATGPSSAAAWSPTSPD